ncbi:hypothetical protein FRC14_000173 [Serendipita sp. 396]|nr:hypothetical protein FRC14_000173 [Serendipita sp. 396]
MRSETLFDIPSADNWASATVDAILAAASKAISFIQEKSTSLSTTTNASLLLGTVLVVILVRQSFKVSQTKPGEPPLLPGTLPLLGHALSFNKDSNKLYEVARNWSPNQGPVSLSVLGQRIYIILNTRDVNAVWRSKSLLFDSVAEWGLATMFGMSNEGAKAIRGDELGLVNMYQDQHGYWRDALAPGDALNSLTQRFLNCLEKDLAKLDEELRQKGTTTFELREFVRLRLGNQSTEAFSGPKLLEDEPDIVKKLAIWDKDFYKLSMGLPRWMLHHAHKNLDDMVKAWQRMNGAPEVLPPLTTRIGMMGERGCSERDKGAANFSIWMATLANALPTNFWLIYQIMRHPELQATLHEEIAPAFNKENSLVDLNHLLNNCPLLHSMYWEALRWSTGAVSTRSVAEDTEVAGYVFYTGALVMSPMRLVNFDRKVFGPDAEDYVPERFLRPHEPEKGIYNPGVKAVKSFGGGVTYCPGRHFALNEIIAFTASVMRRYDLEFVEGQTEAVVLTSAPVVGTFPADKEVWMKISLKN